MGSVTKTAKGWRAFARRNNIRKTNTFNSKTAAKDWIAITESEIENGIQNAHSANTLHDLLDRYLKEVLVKKKSLKWEKDRIRLLQRDTGIIRQIDGF